MKLLRSIRRRRSIAARRGVTALMCLCLILVLPSCARDEGGDEPVTWPELTHFDGIALQAERHVRAGDLSPLDDLRAELIEAGQALTPATIPSNAVDPQRVEMALTDLSNLVDGLSSDLDEDSLTTLVLGLHPVVESLMAAAGMPHVHADHDHDHDHGDHDHGEQDHGDHEHSDHGHGEHDHDEHGDGEPSH